ncbi:MAG: putative two-component sensor histidine kinase protein [Frankiales bacterium]|nr:putative two-component sensor histidine kinase protein [Frankiales bacterium]
MQFLIPATPVLRSLARTVRPLSGAVANAQDAVHGDALARARRHTAALLQAQALGPASWTELDGQSSPVRSGAAHALDLYADDAGLVARLTAYVADGLARGEVCIVIATREHCAGLRARLALTGLDVAAGRGRLVELDADEVLRRFLRDDWPDPELFDLAVAEVVRAACAEGVPVRAFGEMVGLLHTRGLDAAAGQLEKLWESLQRRLGFALLCAYPVSGRTAVDVDLREQACASHSHLVGAVS